mmetsp:Transcript_29618/g.91479  ORF Transcript_29618/g.91479 Transcript_29618/m.91479 type:complete len:322 (+) Transcript_29618:471-1436(+)
MLREQRDQVHRLCATAPCADRGESGAAVAARKHAGRNARFRDAVDVRLGVRTRPGERDVGGAEPHQPAHKHRGCDERVHSRAPGLGATRASNRDNRRWRCASAARVRDLRSRQRPAVPCHHVRLRRPGRNACRCTVADFRQWADHGDRGSRVGHRAAPRGLPRAATLRREQAVVEPGVAAAAHTAARPERGPRALDRKRVRRRGRRFPHRRRGADADRLVLHHHGPVRRGVEGPRNRSAARARRSEQAPNDPSSCDQHAASLPAIECHGREPGPLCRIRGRVPLLAVLPPDQGGGNAQRAVRRHTTRVEHRSPLDYCGREP